MKLASRSLDPICIAAIHHVDDGLCVRIVAPPVRSNAGLATQIPNLKFDVFVSHGLHIEPNCCDRPKRLDTADNISLIQYIRIYEYQTNTNLNFQILQLTSRGPDSTVWILSQVCNWGLRTESQSWLGCTVFSRWAQHWGIMHLLSALCEVDFQASSPLKQNTVSDFKCSVGLYTIWNAMTLD